ncbi:MAG: hypothetical protein GJ676_08765 [Rhodobacteraceae bacterium]|nr:hypothetical protein [Paracoccaceae bacterium]
MKTWDDLTKDQRRFITQYLKKGVKDLVRKRHKTKSNAALIAAYGEYADLDELFEETAAKVPDDYDEKAFIVAQAIAARHRAEQGAFETATEVMAPAIQSMERLRVRLVDEADALRTEIAPTTGIAFETETLAQMDAVREAISRHLTADLPSHAQMEAARAALPAYEAAVLAAVGALGELPAAEALLERAIQQVQDALDNADDVEPDLYTGAPQKPAIDAEVQKATQLRADIASVDRKNLRAMRELAGRLNLFANADVLDPLVEAADLHVRGMIRDYYTQSKPEIVAARDADISQVSAQTQHGALVTLQGELTAGVTLVEATLTGSELAEVRALRTKIDELDAKVETFKSTLDAAILDKQRAELDTAGVKPAHVEGIIALQGVNKDAADKVVLSIGRTEAILGGQKATPDFIRGKQGELTTLEGELKALKDACDLLRTDHRAKRDAFEAAKKDHIDYLAMLGALEDAPTPEQIAERDRLLLVARQKNLAMRQAEQARTAKKAERTAKETDIAACKAVIKAASTQRAMLDAITFGPLSPVAGRPIPADLVGNMVELFDRNPDMAIKTCSLAGTAKDPKKLAETALYLAGKSAAGFPAPQPPGDDGSPTPPLTMNEKDAAYFADRLLVQTAYFGAEYADGIDAALRDGVPYLVNPALNGLTDRKDVARARTTEAAKTMMTRTTDATTGKTTVSLDLNSPDFQQALTRQKYGYSGQYRASAMVTGEIEKLQDFFGDPDEGAARRAKAEEILNAVDATAIPETARADISKLTGISTADLSDPAKTDEVNAAIQTAILRSMATPISQAEVGSCFATAPVRKLRDEDPIAVMEMYKELATTGKFTPKQGRTLPAVTNLPPGDDPLTRSLEFSVASASARLQASRERSHVSNALRTSDAGSLSQLSRKLKKKSWKKLEPELIKVVTTSYTFEYDPMAAASGVSADGSSSQGFMRMVEADTRKEILSQADFVAFITRKSLEAARAAGLKDDELDTIRDHINDPAFIAAVDRAAGKSKPWDMEFGGYGDEAGDALVGRGGSKRGTAIVPRDASESTGERAAKVLEALAGLGGSGGDMTMVSTSGIHAFNALPPTGDYAKLATGDIAANVQSMLVDPGTKIATTALPKDRCVYLYDRQMESFVGRARTDGERDLVKAAFANRPDRDMTPAELEAHISTNLDAFKTAVTQRKLDAWKAGLSAPPSADDERDKKNALRADEDSLFKNLVTRDMIPDLGAPEFIVADSNWGDGSDHYYFVIAPDPLTGEARMWQKSVTGGQLWPMGDKWLNTKWVVDQ